MRGLGEREGIGGMSEKYAQVKGEKEWRKPIKEDMYDRQKEREMCEEMLHSRTIDSCPSCHTLPAQNIYH